MDMQPIYLQINDIHISHPDFGFFWIFFYDHHIPHQDNSNILPTTNFGVHCESHVTREPCTSDFMAWFFANKYH
jgi:hypothetical protein